METHSYAPIPSGVGMEENFFSLDDILLSHERLASRTECCFPRLGFLEKSSDTRDILEVAVELDNDLVIIIRCVRGGNTCLNMGTRIELPLWLAQGLYERKRRVLSVEVPKVYREAWRTVFSADPTVVDLYKMGPYYYGLGSQMLHFESPENTEIAQSVLQTFIGRFRRTMDSSQNAYNEDTSSLVERLDFLERVLFRAGQCGLNAFQSWERGRSSHLSASSLVLNYRKRKMAELQA